MSWQNDGPWDGGKPWPLACFLPSMEGKTRCPGTSREPVFQFFPPLGREGAKALREGRGMAQRPQFPAESQVSFVGAAGGGLLLLQWGASQWVAALRREPTVSSR